jgi:hypothetical protein
MALNTLKSHFEVSRKFANIPYSNIQYRIVTDVNDPGAYIQNSASSLNVVATNLEMLNLEHSIIWENVKYLCENYFILSYF